jgi:tRNA (cytidine/uridine-2'-O-)-methyltransferase
MPGKPRYNVVLVRPEIAGNTGQIGRTCMALDCRLHLVHPLGYQITDKNLKRAGMDYWPLLDLVEHANLEDWIKSVQGRQVVLMSTRGQRDFSPSAVPPGAHIVFGNEGSGLPREVWDHWEDQSLRLPMNAKARSINLSASVALALGALSFGGK